MILCQWDMLKSLIMAQSNSSLEGGGLPARLPRSGGPGGSKPEGVDNEQLSNPLALISCKIP